MRPSSAVRWGEERASTHASTMDGGKIGWRSPGLTRRANARSEGCVQDVRLVLRALGP